MTSCSPPVPWLEAGVLESGDGGPRRRWRPLLAGLVLGAVIGAGAVGVARGPLAALRAEGEAVAAPEWPSPPIPREWRWGGRSYRFDHMFRSRH